MEFPAYQHAVTAYVMNITNDIILQVNGHRNDYNQRIQVTLIDPATSRCFIVTNFGLPETFANVQEICDALHQYFALIGFQHRVIYVTDACYIPNQAILGSIKTFMQIYRVIQGINVVNNG